MPSTGAMSKIAGSASGTLSSYTEFGPPLRMIPVGFHSRIHSTLRVGGWISEYTRASRTRRAMSCVNCEPMSMMRIRELIASELPFRTAEIEELHLLGVEVEQRGSRRSVQPPARLAWVHDHRVILRFETLLVGKAVHDDAV